MINQLLLTIFTLSLLSFPQLPNKKSNQINNDVYLWKEFDFKKDKWFLTGNAYNGSYVSTYLKTKGQDVKVDDFFLMDNTLSLRKARLLLKGEKVFNGGTTGELILKLFKNDKLIWTGYVFLYKEHCVINIEDLSYKINYDAFSFLKQTKSLTQQEYNRIVFKK